MKSEMNLSKSKELVIGLSDVYLMFALQSTDIIPLGDIAVVNTIKELFDVNSKEEMELLSENWKPYRTMATFMLWHYYLEKRNRKPMV